MTGAPSADMSLAHDGSSANAARRRGRSAERRRGSKGHASSLLRLLDRFALVIVALGVFALLVSPGRSATLFAKMVDAAVPESANATRAAAAPRPHSSCKEGGVRCVVELTTLELDPDDEEDDPPDGAAANVAPPFRCLLAPFVPDHVERGELRSDPSRFVDGPGLPRGPPV